MVLTGLMLYTSDGKEYLIEYRLGTGGFGDVYRATDIAGKERVVVKTLRPDVASSSELVEVFEREAITAQQIIHRNVARTIAYIDADTSGVERPCLLIEYVSGGDLAKLLDNRGGELVDEDTLLDWMAQLAEGLQAIHERVLHRDLKPQNVLVNGSTLEISDFGMSKYIAEATRTLTFKGAGTSPYKAPETWRNESATRATDIYSLGIMFYEMATLQLPFTSDDENILRLSHQFDLPAHPRSLRPDLNERVDNMIVRMLAKKPQERYASAAEVVQVITQAQGKA